MAAKPVKRLFLRETVGLAEHFQVLIAEFERQSNPFSRSHVGLRVPVVFAELVRHRSHTRSIAAACLNDPLITN